MAITEVTLQVVYLALRTVTEMLGVMLAFLILTCVIAYYAERNL